MDSENLENAVREYLKSDSGKQLLFYEARSAVQTYVAIWSGVLGVGGIIGLVGCLWWATSTVTEKATESAIASVQEKDKERLAQIDASLSERQRRIEDLGEAAAVLRHRMTVADESLAQLGTLVTGAENRAKGIESRPSGVQGMLDGDKRVSLVEAIKVLDEHENAREILSRLGSLQRDVGKLSNDDLRGLETAFNKRLSELDSTLRYRIDNRNPFTSVRETPGGIQIGNGESSILIRAEGTYAEFTMTTKGGRTITLAANDSTPSDSKPMSWLTMGSGPGTVSIRSGEGEEGKLLLGYGSIKGSELVRVTALPGSKE